MEHRARLEITAEEVLAEADGELRAPHDPGPSQHVPLRARPRADPARRRCVEPQLDGFRREQPRSLREGEDVGTGLCHWLVAVDGARRDDGGAGAGSPVDHPELLQMVQRPAYGLARHAMLGRQLRLGRQPIAHREGAVADGVEDLRRECLVHRHACAHWPRHAL